MSLNYNRVILGGNLTREPELSFTPNQQPVCDFGIAINRNWKGKDGDKREETTFVDCRAFGKTAETVNQYMQKGKPILLEGRLHFSSWEDKNGGGKRSKLRVTVDNFQFVPDGEKREAAPQPAPQAEQPQHDGDPSSIPF